MNFLAEVAFQSYNFAINDTIFAVWGILFPSITSPQSDIIIYMKKY